jgi:hypothetical protein
MKVYGVGEYCDSYNDDDPEQVALDYFNVGSDDAEEIEIYEGESYMPTNQDEIDFLELEELGFMVKNVRLFAIYRYDKKNDCVIEVEK